MTQSSHLSTEHEGDLTLYLTRGQSMYERSSFGAQLERGSMYGLALDASKVTDPINNPYPEAAITRVRSKRGWAKIVEKEIVYTGSHETARPTSEVVNGDIQAPDTKLMENVYKVTRLLDEVGHRSSLCRQALETYYGDQGARYAGGQPGRLFCLYIFTEAGAELLVRDAKEGAAREKLGAPRTSLALHLRMENHAAEEWGRTVLTPVNGSAPNRKPHSKRWRRLILQACDRQSRQLLATSCKHWNRAVQVIGE